MSGVLRLGNTGAGTGRSTVQASASNDQTFLLPEAGGTLLTSNTSIPGGTITLDGATLNITNGDLNVDSGTLFVDESTNRVGIGTTSPSNRLHIIGGSGTTLRLDGANDYNSIADILLNQERARIRTLIDPSGGDPGGSLILSTRNTTANLVDALTIDNSANVTIGRNGSNLFFQNGFNDARSRIQNSGSATNANLRIFTTLSSVQTERFRIENDGDVLIGNPASFSSSGVLNIQTDGNKTISFNATQGELGSCAALIGRNDNGSALVPFGIRASELRFATGTGAQVDKQRMTIDSTGQVLMGTISSRSVLSTGSPGLVQIEVQGGSAYPLTLMANRNDIYGPILAMCKSRGTVAGSQNAIQSGDTCAQLYFGGTDGIGEVGAGYIKSVAAAVPVTGVGVPADILIGTADSTGTISERLKIESSGRLKQAGGIEANGGGSNFGTGSFYRMTATRTIPPGATVDITIIGLSGGWLTVKGGGFANAGQCSFGVFYFIGGYFTQTTEYDVTTIQQFAKNATITVIENPANVVIRIVNNGSNTCNSNWCFESSSAGIQVSS